LNLANACIDLDSQKEKARETLRQLSKLYTEPSSEPNERPAHKYTLCGVSTTNSTMYIRRRPEIDLIDMGLDNEGLPPCGDQWWRINYSSSGSNPVAIEVSPTVGPAILLLTKCRKHQKSRCLKPQRRRAKMLFLSMQTIKLCSLNLNHCHARSRFVLFEPYLEPADKP